MAYDKARQLPAATIATHTLVNESEDNVGEGVMEHNPLKLNILVVVASPYIQKYMPNSIARRCTGKKVMTKQTAEDSVFFDFDAVITVVLMFMCLLVRRSWRDSDNWASYMCRHREHTMIGIGCLPACLKAESLRRVSSPMTCSGTYDG